MYVYVCVNFRDAILLMKEECKTRENLNFTEKWAKKGKLPLQYRLKAWKFSRSWMTKIDLNIGFVSQNLVTKMNFEMV